MSKLVGTLSRSVEGKCLHCEAEGCLSEVIVADTFEYGINGGVVELTASVPVIGCDKCEETWTDYRADEIKHKVIVELFGEAPTKPVVLDEFHYHEVLHTASLFNHMMEDFIISHPVTLQDAEVKKAADVAAEALADLYQAAGNAAYNFREKQNEQNKGN